MASKKEVAEIKERYSDRLLNLPGVVGVGMAQEDDAGEYVLIVNVDAEDPNLYASLPSQIEGCPVKVVKSGRYRKLQT